MKTSHVLSMVLVFVIFVFGYGCSAFDFRSDCVRSEASIKAQYDQNKNSYDNMWKKFKEMAQVPDMYANDLKKLYDGAIKARYGDDGSKAMFQFIQEHNPNLDSAVYTKLQAAIESGRNSFQAEQASLIDRKREYETLLNGNRALFVNVWFEFPRINLNDYNIVTSDATEKAFHDGKSDNIQLR